MRKASTYLLIFALAVVSTAANASGQERQRPRSAPPARGSEPSSAPAPSQDRSTARPTERRDTPPQTSQAPRNDTRGYSGPSRNDPRLNDNRSDTRRATDTRGLDARRPEPQRQAVPAPRDRFDSRYDGRYDGRYDSRSFRADRYVTPYRYSSSRIIIAPREPVRFTRSWFNFRPWYRLDVGLLVGYALDFPTWYDPYIVGQPGYVRPYMPYGGVTFDIEPRDAELWVDGEYLGRAADYSPYDPPLTLVAGRHHVELTGRYYRSIEFDITVVAGQVIPYQGTLPYVR